MTVGSCRPRGSPPIPIVRRTESEAELEALLHTGAPVVLVHGPMGVGKTFLLRSFAARCEAAGNAPLWVDGTVTCVDELLTVLHQVRDREKVMDGPQPTLLICDSNVPLRLLEDLLVGGGAEQLPPRVSCIVSSRREPSKRTRLHTEWGSTVRALRVAPVTPDAAKALIEELDVPPDEREAVLTFGGGSPLLLKLAAQHAQESPHGLHDPRELEDALRGLLPLQETEGVCDVRGTALHVCAMARRTTPEMLLHLLDDPAGAQAAFGWLGTLSFVDDTSEGLRMQQVPRRALVQELRAHYPTQYLRLHRRLKEYCAAQVDRSVDGHRWIECAFYLDQQVSELRHYVVWEDAPVCRRVDSARSGDWSTLHHAVLEHEGEHAARILKHWAEVIPDSVEVARGTRRAPEGLMVTLPLDRRLVHDHLDQDPALEVVRAYMEAKGASEEEPWGLIHRFWMDLRAYQGPSPVLTELLIHMVARGLGVQVLPFSLCVTRDAQAWMRLTRILDIPAEVAGEFDLEGAAYSLIAVDWRATDRADWMYRFVQRPMDEIGELWWKRVAGSARIASGGALRETLRPGAALDVSDSPPSNGGLGDLIMHRMRRLAREAQLTSRESEVLDLLLLGRNTEEIALVLGIAPRTAKFHQGNVLRKLGADSRADLVRLLL
jgi:DNA-binding CsgD family transcriptional regulator